MFTVTDWQRLAMLAELVEAFFSSPSAALMAEIRLNEERLGATPTDRLRLGYRTDPPNAPNSGGGRSSSALERARDRESIRDRLRRLDAEDVRQRVKAVDDEA